MLSKFQKVGSLQKSNIRTFMSLDRIPICALTGERRHVCDCSCLDSCKGPPAIMACIEAGMIETISYNSKKLQEEILVNKIEKYDCSEDKKLEILKKKKLPLPKQYKYISEEYGLMVGS